jgi:hypothetical protein
MVGDEAAQAGPAVADAAYRAARDLLVARHGVRHVDLLRLHVRGGHGSLVGGRDQQHPALGLDVEALVEVDHHRPG